MYTVDYTVPAEPLFGELGCLISADQGRKQVLWALSVVPPGSMVISVPSSSFSCSVNSAEIRSHYSIVKGPN